MTKLMIFDGFWVLSNTDRTWFSMFFIKNRSFRVFQENYTLLPFDRSPKSSETSHFRCCEICYWQQDLSDDPKRRIHQKISENYPIFGFRLSMGTDFGIQNSENLAVVRVRFVENCFSTFEMCCRLYRVQNNHITITHFLKTTVRSGLTYSPSWMFFFLTDIFFSHSVWNLVIQLQGAVGALSHCSSSSVTQTIHRRREVNHKGALELACNSTHKRARAPEPVSGM